ncbi:hypothetical protein ISN44_As03g040660 [Arabidopsis suecica]|nr:hypothetical protein ISN44_As03g040660 [Arabidopsis suecica]
MYTYIYIYIYRSVSPNKKTKTNKKMLSKIKPVVLMSFLLLFPLCSSGFREGHGVTHTDQNSLNKVEESIPTIMDYPEPGPDPKHDPTKPGYGFPPPPPPPLSPPPPPKMN